MFSLRFAVSIALLCTSAYPSACKATLNTSEPDVTEVSKSDTPPPLETPTAVSSKSEQPASAEGSVSDPVEPIVESLHPTFRLTSEQVKAALEKGEEYAKKKKMPKDFLGRYRQQPRWVRGQSGKVHESYVYCLNMDGIPLTMEAYTAKTRYEPYSVAPEYLEGGMYMTSLQFDVLLTDVPKVPKWRWQHYDAADPVNVKAIRFVLENDKGTLIQSETGSLDTSTTSGEMRFSRVRSIPNTSTTRTTYDARASVTGSGGYAYGYGSGSSTSTSTWYSYHAWTETHPYYQARYNVEFPLFGADGRAIIGPETKKFILHIVLANGEQQVEYKLPTVKPAK